MKTNQAVYIIVSNTNFLRGKNPLNDAKIKLKSLSLIHFVKIRLFKFWGKEFLVKIYKLLQIYIFDIDNLLKILYI